MRRRGWRINLRPLADIRNLAWIPIAWFLLYHSLRFLAWLVVALVSGGGEAAAGSGGSAGAHGRGGAYQHQHW